MHFAYAWCRSAYHTWFTPYLLFRVMDVHIHKICMSEGCAGLISCLHTITSTTTPFGYVCNNIFALLPKQLFLSAVNNGYSYSFVFHIFHLLRINAYFLLPVTSNIKQIISHQIIYYYTCSI